SLCSADHPPGQAVNGFDWQIVGFVQGRASALRNHKRLRHAAAVRSARCRSPAQTNLKNAPARSLEKIAWPLKEAVTQLSQSVASLENSSHYSKADEEMRLFEGQKHADEQGRLNVSATSHFSTVQPPLAGIQNSIPPVCRIWIERPGCHGSLAEIRAPAAGIGTEQS